MTRGKIPTKMVLGIPIAALRLKEISFVIARLIETSGKKTFFYVNAHCLNIAGKDPVYKKILQGATLVYSGGMGPILASRILGRPLLDRTPTPDFISDVFVRAQRNKWSFYLLGGEENVARKAAENLWKRFPGLAIVGYHSGFFTNNNEIIKKINRVKPDIILVGVGTPRQEKWIADNIDKVNAKVFWAVGALFDILSGKRKRAPKWMQRLGFEWAFRLLQEPRRLWKRYIFGNIGFLLTVFREREHFSHKSGR